MPWLTCARLTVPQTNSFVRNITKSFPYLYAHQRELPKNQHVRVTWGEAALMDGTHATETGTSLAWATSLHGRSQWALGLQEPCNETDGEQEGEKRLRLKKKYTPLHIPDSVMPPSYPVSFRLWGHWSSPLPPHQWHHTSSLPISAQWLYPAELVEYWVFWTGGGWEAVGHKCEARSPVRAKCQIRPRCLEGLEEAVLLSASGVKEGHFQ